MDYDEREIKRGLRSYLYNSNPNNSMGELDNAETLINSGKITSKSQIDSIFKKESISLEKRKAMERLIFLVRTKQTSQENIGERLDKLGIAKWKQNYIAMLSQETDMYMNNIIQKVYYLKKPTDFKR